MTQAGTIMGTPAYMSPEQFMGQTVDARTDIYSSGVLLFQLLTGERPFEGSMATIMHKALNTVPPKPSEISVTAPRSFDAVVARAMARRPEDRYPSAAAFAEAITAALAQPAPPAEIDPEATVVAGPAPKPATTAPPPPRATQHAPSRSRTPLLAGAALVVLAAAGGGAWFALSGPAPPKAADTATAPAPTPPAPRVTQVTPPVTAPPIALPPPANPPPSTPVSQPPPPRPTVVEAQPSTAPAPTPEPRPAVTQVVPRTGPPASGAGAGPAAQQAQIVLRPTARPTTTDLPPAQPGRDRAARAGASCCPGRCGGGAPTRRGRCAARAVRRRRADPAAGGPEHDGTRSGAGPCASRRGCASPARPREPSAGAISSGRARGHRGGRPEPGRAAARSWRRGARDGVRRDRRRCRPQRVRSCCRVWSGAGGRNRSCCIAFAMPPRQRRSTGRSAWRTGPYCGALNLVRAYVRPFGAGSGGMDIGLKGGKTDLVENDRVDIRTVAPDFPAYVQVDYFSSDGTVAHLRKSATGTPATAPRATVEIAGFEAAPPFGTDVVTAIAVSTPLFTREQALSEKTDDYVRELRTALDTANRRKSQVAAAAIMVKTSPKP